MPWPAFPTIAMYRIFMEGNSRSKRLSMLTRSIFRHESLISVAKEDFEETVKFGEFKQCVVLDDRRFSVCFEEWEAFC